MQLVHETCFLFRRRVSLKLKILDSERRIKLYKVEISLHDRGTLNKLNLFLPQTAVHIYMRVVILSPVKLDTSAHWLV
jgi:hypothetical protein